MNINVVPRTDKQSDTEKIRTPGCVFRWYGSTYMTVNINRNVNSPDEDDGIFVVRFNDSDRDNPYTEPSPVVTLWGTKSHPVPEDCEILGFAHSVEIAIKSGLE